MAMETFKERIKIDSDFEYLLDLQDKFEKGLINEEDIPIEQREKLYKLYEEQIKKIKSETENYKKAIMQIRQKLNSNKKNS